MVKPSKPHVALLASPGLGHLIPVVALANRLVTQHGLTVTVFVIPTDSTHQAESDLLRLTASTHQTGLFNPVILPNVPDPTIDLTEPIVDVMALIFLRIRSAIPTLQSLIYDMKAKPTAFIVDHFGVEAVHAVGSEFNLLKYVFVASNARFMSYYAYLPYVPQSEINPNNPFCIPGCEPIPGQDLPVITFHPNSTAHRDLVDSGRNFNTVDGMLVNTFEDLEPQTLGSLKSILKPPVYPIGPVIRNPQDVKKTGLMSLIEWLDVQPDKSVIYVSFGSGGTLSTEQTIELASGLESSKHRFIWVIRSPIENNSIASYLKSEDNKSDKSDKLDESVYNFLPNGFLDRTRDLGIVIQKWVPQLEILRHGSIGGFVNHCGWNSVMESVVNGVPMIAWPLYAEQDMNSTMLVERLGVAIRPKARPSKEVVRRDEIKGMVKYVMGKDGFGLRKRVEEVKMWANRALLEGGSSYLALSKVAKDCEEKMNNNSDQNRRGWLG